MSDPVILVKEKAEKVQVDLRKKGITTFPPLRVRARLDVSGSAHWLYDNGTMERTLEKLLGVAFTFDDNGSIEMGVFDSRAHILPDAEVKDYGRYVRKHILPNWRNYGNSTNYRAALQQEIDSAFGGVGAVVDKTSGFLGGLFGKKPAAAPAAGGKQPPVLLFFVTDGDPDQGCDGHDVMEAAARRNLPIYFSLVGVGKTRSNFATLRRMADDYDNVGFVNLDNIDISDEALFDALNTAEFISFLKKHGAA